MNKIIKTIISKEILIITVCAILIGLTWLFFTLKNNYTLHQVENLQKLELRLSNEIDSIQASFPQRKTTEGLPLPPPHGTWIIYQKHTKQLEELKGEISLTKSRIYTANAMLDNMKWVSIVVLTMVYPIRLLFLALKWAIKTLRLK